MSDVNEVFRCSHTFAAAPGEQYLWLQISVRADFQEIIIISTTFISKSREFDFWHPRRLCDDIEVVFRL